MLKSYLVIFKNPNLNALESLILSSHHIELGIFLKQLALLKIFVKSKKPSPLQLPEPIVTLALGISY